jgi:hypothetical protein
VLGNFWQNSIANVPAERVRSGNQGLTQQDFSMSYAWSVVGRALVGFLIVCCGAAMLAPLFGEVSLSAYPDRQAEAVDRIELALQQPVSFRVVDMPLVEVISRLSDKLNITIVLTKKIEDAGVQPDQPVSRDISDVSAEAFLKLVLGDLNLTTMVTDEVLKITTIEDAQSPENMVTRIYPVADLLDYYRLPAAEGGGVCAEFDPLVDLLTSTLEPDSWQDVGGPASVNGHDNSRTLVVSQRRDVHLKIAGTLTTLRRAKRLQAVSLHSMPLSTNSPLPMASGGSLPIRSRVSPSGMGGTFGAAGGGGGFGGGMSGGCF